MLDKAGSHLLLIDKPLDWSSHDVVNFIRFRLGRIKTGHAGTLDPFATGLLVLGLGRGTRLINYMENYSKGYLATMQLGSATDTQDRTGTVTDTALKVVTEADLAAALPSFTGDIEQVPPMYSALKIEGRKLYKMARAGQVVERPARQVTIHQLELVDFSYPTCTLKITCSKGTYMRTLCHDLAIAVGSFAHLTALERLSVGPYQLADALAIAGKPPAEVIAAAAKDTSFMLPELPAHCLTPAEREYILNGRLIAKPEELRLAEGEVLKLLDATGAIVAIGRCKGDLLAPERVLIAK